MNSARIWLSLITVVTALYLIWPPLFFLAVGILFAGAALAIEAASNGYRGS
ncbi:hypothetical protein GWE18_00200 [Bradyrhizobium sp. CSA112]|uniref:hypothetical protein n=1 Tax=Bradyrhizobium sp. CSA112 TaxID=2699170 RepID=UPI0023AEA6F1|nr:hypothetical protein [Bradyrhizobium sp. CSA112]MDE5451297.1 hypothetical protein [Bradyrhizobium sp. CSA112]